MIRQSLKGDNLKNMFASSLPSSSSAMTEVAHFDFAQKFQFMLGAFKYFSQTVSKERFLAGSPSGHPDAFFFSS